jgi:hypothetical protein
MGDWGLLSPLAPRESVLSLGGLSPDVLSRDVLSWDVLSRDVLSRSERRRGLGLGIVGRTEYRVPSTQYATRERPSHRVPASPSPRVSASGGYHHSYSSTRSTAGYAKRREVELRVFAAD